MGARKDTSNRIIEIDILRGVCVLLMIFDHFLSNIYDLMPYIFSDFPSPGFWQQCVFLCSRYWDWWLRNCLHYIVCFFFLSLTGVCSCFSRSNIQRGAKLFGVALLVTLATFIVGKAIDNIDMTITFGVLHCIAITLILVGVCQKFIKNDWVYLAIGLIATIIGIIIEQSVVDCTYIGANPFDCLFNQIMGFEMYGSDSFPLLQNGGQIFIGVFIGKVLYKDRKSLFGKEYKNNIITLIGRNSLLVYILHQIILPVLLGVILLICGFHLSI